MGPLSSFDMMKSGGRLESADCNIMYEVEVMSCNEEGKNSVSIHFLSVIL